MSETRLPISEAGLPATIINGVVNVVVAENLSDDFEVDVKTKKLHVRNTFTGQGPAGPAGEGFDYAQLTEKQFEQGSKVLAFDQQGQPYLFAQDESYLKDVAISLEQGAYQKLENNNTQYEVTARIQNTKTTQVGELTAAFSAGGVIRDMVTSTSTAVVNSIQDNVVNISNLEGYGIVEVKFKVEVSDNSYVTGTVTTNGDTVSSNNQSTLNLVKLAVSQQHKNQYTETCPYIQAVVKDDPTQTELAVGTQELTNNVPYDSYSIPLEDIGGVNVVPGKESLQGTTLVLSGASTVSVHATYGVMRGDSGRFEGDLYVKHVGGTKYKSWFLGVIDYDVLGSGAYTFNPATGELTFNEPIISARIFMRPQGSSCKWQTLLITANERELLLSTATQKIRVEGLPDEYLNYEFGGLSGGVSKFEELKPIEVIPSEIKIIGVDTTGVRFISSNRDYWGSQTNAPVWGAETATVTTISTLVISLPAGSSHEFDIYTQQGTLNETQGNINIRWDTGKYHITVLETATATDNVNTASIKIDIN